ncbi:MAG: hypothetical protein JHC38_10750 [Thiotrichales bacterium]|jgi:hypothetical protein|nr:hypothetical protein [Thiotrichales bacterium]
MNQQTELKTIIDFHGIKLPVVIHDGMDYVPLRPISDMLNLVWNSAKRTAFDGDNATLYGTALLNLPKLAAYFDTSVEKTEVFIRLKSTSMYLARASTNMMKAKGNLSGAEYLLKMQEEWADALYQYETKGVAYKESAIKDLKSLIDAMHKLPIGKDKQRMQQLISATLDKMSIPSLDDKQQQLPLGAQA